MNYAEATRIMPGIIHRAAMRGQVKFRSPQAELAARAEVAAFASRDKIGETTRGKVLRLAATGLPFTAADVGGDAHSATRACRALVDSRVLAIHRAARPRLGIGITYIGTKGNP